MSIGKKLIFCFYAMLILSIVFLTWIFFTIPQDNRIKGESLSLLQTELLQEGNVQQKTLVLPEEFEESQSLLFRSKHTELVITLGDDVVYTFGRSDHRFGKSPGIYWHVVDLPANSAGKLLTLQQTAVYNTFYDSAETIQYGSHGDCILHLINSFLPVLIINCISIFAGLLSLFLHIATTDKNDRRELGSFLCIGFFALTAAAWSLRQCGFLQFLIPNGVVLYFADTFLMFLFPIPFNLFTYTICQTTCKKGFAVMAAMYLTEMIVETTLQFLGIVDIYELLLTLHIAMLINAVYVFWAVRKERLLDKDSMVSRFRIPLYILIVFGLLEIVAYYIPILNSLSIFLPLGMFVFIVMLIWQQISDYYQSILEKEKMFYYEKLANTDMLTGAYNRNAYEAELKALEKGETDPNGQCIVLFDLNNMKIINDNFGHEKGDEALKNCYQCIQTVFGDRGKCYRIGGDEFVILSRNESELDHAVKKFNQAIKYVAQQVEYPFGVAIGYAAFHAEKDDDFRATIRRSDARMYKDKLHKKAI